MLAGERSLLERGLLGPMGEHRTRASPELDSILVVRDTPLSVTIVDLAHDGAVSSCYAYGLGDPAFLLTETVEAGDHVFAIRTPASTADAIADDLDPDAFTAAA